MPDPRNQVLVERTLLIERRGEPPVFAGGAVIDILGPRIDNRLTLVVRPECDVGPLERTECDRTDFARGGTEAGDVVDRLRELRRRSGLQPEKRIDSVGGFIVRSEDGTTEFNSTFEARLERMKPSTRKRVYERYFKESR